MSSLPEMLAATLAHRLLYLIPVLLAGLVLGEPLARLLRFTEIRRWLVGVLASLNRKLNRPQRSIATRLYRGMVVVIVALLLALLGGLLLVHSSVKLLAPVLLVALFGALLRPYHFLRLRQQAAAGTLPLSASQSDFLFADSHARVRYTIVDAAQRMQLTLGASCFFLLGGIPSLLIYLTLALAAAAFHPALDSNRAFGWAAHGLWRLANALPRVLFTLLGSLAALCVPGTSPVAALKQISGPWHDWLAALLGLSIGGPIPTAGGILTLPWLGSGTPKPETRHLTRCLAVLGITFLLWLLLLLSMTQPLPIHK